MQLRYYQKECIVALYEWLYTNPKNPLCVMATASGKSVVIAQFIKTVLQQYPETRIICCIDTKELVDQNYKKLLELWPSAPAGVCSAGLGRKQFKNQILFAGIQSIYRHSSKVGNCDILIIDECFAGDTLISTPKGLKQIKHVGLDDLVVNAVGYGKVRAISKKATNIIYNVRLSNGENIRCTANHPFLSDAGWCQAKQLERGDRLICLQNMQDVWEGVFTKERQKTSGDKPLRNIINLQSILCKEVDKSYAESRFNRQNESIAEKDWSQAIASWWKWQRINGTTEDDIRNSGKRMVSRNSNSNKNAKSNENVSHVLQGGCGELAQENSNRTGWKKPLWQEKDARRKKGQFLDVVRVESIEIEECRGGEYVYNLEVEGHPSYFANGALAHNCHMSNQNTDSMWHKFITELSPKRVIGFTATPYRNDCGLIYTGENAIYGGIAYEYTIKQGIRDKYLSEIVPKGMSTHFDVTGVKTNNGDFAEGELQECVNIEGKNISVINEIIEYGKDRKGWLIFSAGRDHAKELHTILTARGYEGAVILGETPDKLRDEYIVDFKAGKLLYLINNSVLTKGFDAPHIDLIAAVRPTKSIVLWVQQIGRGLRLAEGKKNCLLLDFAENVQRFGLLDEIVFNDKKKSDKEGVPPVKTCPECDSIVAASIAECPFCGHVFPKPEPEFNRKAYDGIMLSTQIVPEWKNVEAIHISKHKSKNPTPTLKIEYVCENFERYFDYICLEHEAGSFPRNKAIQWWMKNAIIPIPKTIDDALMQGLTIVKPARIKVIQDGKFWRVLEQDNSQPLQLNPPVLIDRNDASEIEW